VLRRDRSGWRTDAPASLLVGAFPPGVFRALALAASLLLAGAGRSTAADFSPADLAQKHHGPHRLGEIVCVAGYAEMIHAEADGDVHVWVCPTPTKRHMPERRRECVLAEIVPGRPLPRPRRGAHVKVCGRWVEEDSPHLWTELHPATSVEVLP